MTIGNDQAVQRGHRIDAPAAFRDVCGRMDAPRLEEYMAEETKYSARALRVAYLFDHLNVRNLAELLRMVAAKVAGEEE